MRLITFEAGYELLKNLEQQWEQTKQKTLQDHVTATTVAFHEKYPRWRKLTGIKNPSTILLECQKKEATLFETIHQEWREKAEDLWATYTAQNKRINKILNRLARNYVVPDADRWMLFTEVWSGTYASTNQGDHYAQKRAELYALDIEVHNVETEVRKDRPSLGWSVFVKTTPVGIDALKRKPGMPLREWVRLCWAKSVNPRVYNPFLEPGYEDRVGIDYFGREKS